MPPKSATMKKVNKRNRKLLYRLMRGGAKDALQQALNEEELHVEEVRGEMAVGNRRGLSLAGLPERIRVLEQQVDEIPSLKIRVASLEDRVGSLTSSLSDYKLQRNRFLSTYKRDKLGDSVTMTEADRRIIAEGNVSVHGGDAVFDVTLYSSTGRRDDAVYERLYGVDPLRVLAINEFFAILGITKTNLYRLQVNHRRLEHPLRGCRLAVPKWQPEVLHAV